MTRISVDEIKRDLRGYLQRVEAGETLVILDEGNPVAEVRTVERLIQKYSKKDLGL